MDIKLLKNRIRYDFKRLRLVIQSICCVTQRQCPTVNSTDSKTIAMFFISIRQTKFCYQFHTNLIHGPISEGRLPRTSRKTSLSHCPHTAALASIFAPKLHTRVDTSHMSANVCVCGCLEQLGTVVGRLVASPSQTAHFQPHINHAIRHATANALTDT